MTSAPPAGPGTGAAAPDSTRSRIDDAAVSLRRMPTWYRSLFTADVFERFGFYGLQAVLVLYAAAPRAEGGLGLPATEAAALFGAWIAAMFTLSWPGGWLGDRVLGQRPAMLIGSCLSTAGFLLLALPGGVTGALALCLLAVGGGLFKPNHQALLNLMFGGHRGRESGISLMYVATQVSALLAPLVAGFLGERVNWGLAFVACGAGMALAGASVWWGSRHFADTGRRAAEPLGPGERARVVRRTGVWIAVLAALLAVLAVTGALAAGPLAGLASLSCLVLTVGGYLRLYRDPDLGDGDRRRLRAFLIVLFSSTLFWTIAAHSGSLLNLFARDHVDREVFGFVVPASWLQSLTPLMILLLAPAIAAVLPRLGGAHHVPVKFATGLGLVGAAFLVMAAAAAAASSGALVSPWWLAVVYLGTACGEVIIAAVSIAATADVLPARFLSRMLGLFWLFAALGGAFGSGLVRLAEVIPAATYYLGLGSFALCLGAALAVGRRRLARGLAPDTRAG
jgi:POT family proton-dependent oligopeptide transporter